MLTDSVVQEIDMKTGLVMWEWHALGHISLGESNNPAPKASYPWDYVHINSIARSRAAISGDVLLSSRNTWTLYDVDIHSGAIRWRLGGSHSSFKLGPGTRFYWQHDAEWQPGGLISVFDNGSDPPKEKQSRGLLLKPDLADHTVTLVKQFINPTKTLLASSQGNLLNLSAREDTAGNWLMGYGGLPNFTEYDPSGHVLLDGTLGKSVQDFRTYLSPWSGQAPAMRRRLAVTGSTVAVSWNGATNVASWRVLAGASASALAPVASAAKAGFQTTISVPASAAYVAVQALDGRRGASAPRRQSKVECARRRPRRACARACRTGLAGGARVLVGWCRMPAAYAAARRSSAPLTQLRAPATERLRGARRRTRDGLARPGNQGCLRRHPDQHARRVAGRQS